MYTVILSENTPTHCLYTVGYYTDKEWVPRSDHSTREEAQLEADRLNGVTPKNAAQLPSLREQYAGQFMAVLIGGGMLREPNGRQAAAEAAVEAADALIEALEKI